MRLFFLILSVTLIAACSHTVAQGNTPAIPAIDPTAYPQGPDDTCGAISYAILIGKKATALEQIKILAAVRVIHPGSIVTQDYMPDRLNFLVNAQGEISGLRCG